MRLPMTSAVILVLALPAGSAVSQEPPTPTPACHARGSRQWLATRPSPLDSAVVTVRGAVAKICYSRPSARGRSVNTPTMIKACHQLTLAVPSS
jgi:hypothetical protein